MVLLLSARTHESLSAVSGDAGQSYTYSVDVGLVVLPVSVTDHHGNSVSNLDEHDFRIFENGIPQKIEQFDHRDIPAAVGLVIDNSGSMAAKHTEVVLSALALARGSNRDDQIFVVHFNEHIRFGLKSAPFTNNLETLAQVVGQATANGKTALYDAVIAALEHLKGSNLKKKALVVISDGGDNASSHTLQQALREAQASQAIIYTIGIFAPYQRDKNPGALKELARATGGTCSLPTKLTELRGICQHIARDIRTQYTLGYVSTDSKRDGTYRSIRVQVEAPHRRKLFVRTRAGYLAPSDSTSASRRPSIVGDVS